MEPYYYIEKKSVISKDALLKRAVANAGYCYEDMEYAVSDTGKPYFKNSSLFFNTADTKNYVAAAVFDADIGIDIEEITRKADTKRLADRFFSAAEQEYVRTHADKRYAFFRIWTRKEALLKADGIGIRLELASFDTTPDTVVFKNKSYRFTDITTDGGVICSICTRNKLLD